MELNLYLKTFVEGHGTYYWTCVLIWIVTSAICAGEAAIVKECPTTRLSWEERAENFTCNTQNGFSYHCILDNTQELVETCVARTQVPQGKVGCPEVTFHGGVAYHSNENTRCPSDNAFCPSGKTAYFSDQLYIYPICFVKVSTRAIYPEQTTEAMDKSTENKDSDKMKYKECSNDRSKDSSTTVIALAILVAILALLIVTAVIFICRGKEHKDFVPLKIWCNKSSGNEEPHSSKQPESYL